MTARMFFIVMLCSCAAPQSLAQDADVFVPRRQTQLPGPPLSPQEAVRKMTVPEGFSVEIVAAEPDILNPVAMTFDERGRAWITESFEYPRRSAGPGRDRVKVLEDTNGDGTMDKVTVFAEGLNIPSGIAVGHGGVWVANSPDILFLQDTDGDDKADRQEVVVTGFGRTDTHELPNSLTWGPDGWLYGLNGVFNYSHVKTKDGDFPFTCALFRIHPRTRKFELFAEGTSNPWGIAWNPVGDAFLSACVIDHLWHLTESGYYHRQGGPYPAFTWKLESIVKHKHQLAAYCGIHYFDSDAYPAEYRDRLYMGNIHGNCLNVDVLQNRGATYFATPAPDFLTANDVWFMPVVQKTGPDGCLYVLDWYDRYHCYQDANRDPEGIDRLHGRLYRVRYQNSPRAAAFDLNSESDEQLVQRLQSPNVYFRDIAQRVLSERASRNCVPLLEALVLDDSKPLKPRLHALWSLIGAEMLRNEFLLALLDHPQHELRWWAVRAAGDQKPDSADVMARIRGLSGDEHARVRLQVAIAAPKLNDVPTIETLTSVLSHSGDDPIIPQIVWQNLYPLLDNNADELVTALKHVDPNQRSAVLKLLPRVLDRLLAARELPVDQLSALTSLALDTPQTDAGSQCLQLLSRRAASGEMPIGAASQLWQTLSVPLADSLKHPEVEPGTSAVELAASIGQPEARHVAAEAFATSTDSAVRIRLLEALITSDDHRVHPLSRSVLQEQAADVFRRQVIQALGRTTTDDTAELLLHVLPALPAALKPVAIETLTRRASWGIRMLRAVAEKTIDPSMINANQARNLLGHGDATLSELVTKHWGTVRTERDPQRIQFIDKMRNQLISSRGDAFRGQAVFKKVCGQCHKMYGEGAEVGPDITANGRSSFEQLLSNVFDPSLVIGASYQAVTVVTVNGKAITGLPVEDNEQRIVLKVQGNKLETIPRSQIEESVQSKLSMMPEGVEKQLKPDELIDLFAFLKLTHPPGDPRAKLVPGAR